MMPILESYVAPPLLPPPPPPPLPPANVLLASVSEKTVGVGGRVGMDRRGPFSVTELRGIRLDAVARYELWAHTPAEVGQVVEDLISNLLTDRDSLRTRGFLRVDLKSVEATENVFAEDAWRQAVKFDVLFEFPYFDTDGAESLIARIPIDINSEFNESTIVVDEMARWDNEEAPALEVRGRERIGALTALAFIPALQPAGKVIVRRTFDGASGAPATHTTLTSFIAAVSGDNPIERHSEIVFASLKGFLEAVATFNITDDALTKMSEDGVPDPVIGLLENIKNVEVQGQGDFLTLVEDTIGFGDTTTHQAVILKHAAILDPIILGDWDANGILDQYTAVERRINPAINLSTVSDRLEVAFEHPELTEVAVVYLRVSSGPST